MKNCPRCGSGLAETIVGETRVDGCRKCGGVWFDNHELSAVAGRGSQSLLELEARFPRQTDPGWRPAGPICPACEVPLQEFEFPHAPGIPLDGCPLCKGIWVDD